MQTISEFSFELCRFETETQKFSVKKNIWKIYLLRKIRLYKTNSFTLV